MNVKIKNCPFCKSDRVELLEKRSRGANSEEKVVYYVKCHKCLARGSAYAGTPAGAGILSHFAVIDWNKAAHAPEEVSG